MAVAQLRPGPSLFLRIFIVLLLSVLAAQAVNFVALLLAPPPSLPINSMVEIRDALATGDDATGRLIVRLDAPPPALPEAPRVEALRLRLATSLGRSPDDVRLSVLRDWPAGRWLVPPAFSFFHRHRRLPPGDAHSDHVVGRFFASLHLSDGRWRVVTPADRAFRSWQWRTMLSLLAITIAVAPPAWLLARWLSAPIREFARAAERLGRDPYAPPLSMRGPPEIIVAAQALNEMQRRLGQYIDDRTTMITAIAHDLRTPLMRLAFRLEDASAEVRKRVEPDIAEMKTLIASALVFARETNVAQNRQRIDMRSLLESLVHSKADQGYDTVILPGDDVVVTGDSLALSALFGNILENAVRYGSRARIALSSEPPWARVDIDDDGPGLAEGQLDRVFDPFYRAEPSRSRDTGGTGLGLAIVRAIAKAHEGKVSLTNRASGGLRATVLLPLAPDPASR
jgi:signal transduction histidine kinase